MSRDAGRDTLRAMMCSECREESDEMTVVRVNDKKRSLCPECHEVWEEEQEVAKEAGAVMRGMMEYKG